MQSGFMASEIVKQYNLQHPFLFKLKGHYSPPAGAVFEAQASAQSFTVTCGTKSENAGLLTKKPLTWCAGYSL